MTGRASGRHVREAPHDLLRGRSLGDRIRQCIHVFVDRHAQLFERQRQFDHNRRFNVGRHAHARFPGNRGQGSPVKFRFSKAAQNAIDRFQQEPHLSQDLIPLGGGESNFCSTVASRCCPSRHQQPRSGHKGQQPEEHCDDAHVSFHIISPCAPSEVDLAMLP